jgi:large subunit ribosomal protein L21
MKRCARNLGFLILIGAGFALVLWLLRDKIAGPAPAPVSPADAPKFRVPPAEAPSGDSADDLCEINGIGPVYCARLIEAGISTFAALAAADAAAIAARIDTAESRVTEWISQARDLAAG